MCTVFSFTVLHIYYFVGKGYADGCKGFKKCLESPHDEMASAVLHR